MSSPLHPSPYTLAPSSRSGFTLIEMLVVIAVSAMLAAVTIGYSSVGRNEIALSVEKAKISQIILQAKSLAIATYGNSIDACAYGASFNIASQTYSIFAYHPSSTSSCPPAASTTSLSGNEMQPYTSSTWKIPLENGVVMYATSTNTLYDVLFYPPQPITLISNDGKTFPSPAQASNVYLETVGGSATQTISVSPSGQVEF